MMPPTLRSRCRPQAMSIAAVNVSLQSRCLTTVRLWTRSIMTWHMLIMYMPARPLSSLPVNRRMQVLSTRSLRLTRQRLSYNGLTDRLSRSVQWAWECSTPEQQGLVVRPLRLVQSNISQDRQRLPPWVNETVR